MHRSQTAGAGSRTRTYDLQSPKNFAVSEIPVPHFLYRRSIH